MLERKYCTCMRISKLGVAFGSCHRDEFAVRLGDIVDWYFCLQKGSNVLALWVGVAFCLFAISYVLTILGFGNSLFLIPLRAFGYLSVIAGLILLHKR